MDLSLPHTQPDQKTQPCDELHRSLVRAGFPSPATDHLDGVRLDLHDYLMSQKASCFYFTVDGDSMAGAGILPGDHVLVDRSINPRDGHIVIAEVNKEHSIKTLRITDGIFSLVPANPKYKPRTFRDGDELVVWGVVTAVIRKLAV